MAVISSFRREPLELPPKLYTDQKQQVTEALKLKFQERRLNEEREESERRLIREIARLVLDKQRLTARAERAERMLEHRAPVPVALPVPALPECDSPGCSNKIMRSRRQGHTPGACRGCQSARFRRENFCRMRGCLAYKQVHPRPDERCPSCLAAATKIAYYSV